MKLIDGIHLEQIRHLVCKTVDNNLARVLWIKARTR